MAKICSSCNRKLGFFESFGDADRRLCAHCLAVAAAGGGASASAGSSAKASSSEPSHDSGSVGGEIGPDDINAERLKAIFDAAYMDCKIDSDGDLYVKGGACGVYIYIAKDPGLLRMESLYAPEPHATRAQKLELCNRVNDRMRLARAYVRRNGRFGFDYFFPVQGGIDEKVLVLTLKRFTRCVVDGIKSCDDDDIVK